MAAFCVAGCAMDDHPSWGGNRGTRYERGYGTAWTKLRLTILQRDCYLCQQCMRDGRVTALCVKPYDHAVDHIKPKAKGGTDHPSNLQSLCAEHHLEKSLREAAEGSGTKIKPRPKYDANGFPIWD